MLSKELESCSPGTAELDSLQKEFTTLKYTDEKRKERGRDRGNEERGEGGKEGRKERREEGRGERERQLCASNIDKAKKNLQFLT